MIKRPKITKRREAARRGLLHYFTGKPCKHNHIAIRYTVSGHCLECDRIAVRRFKQSDKSKNIQRRYDASPKGRERNRRYAASPKGRERNRRMRNSPKGQETIRRYTYSPKGREKNWRYRRSPKGQETIREIGRRSRYRASGERAARDRERRLEQAEAAYKASPTQANYDRLMRLIARRTT